MTRHNPKDRATLVDRLRGTYRIPITDGLGPAGGLEPNNPLEHVARYEVPPINHEAAAEIEYLRSMLTLAAQSLIANPTARVDAGEVDMTELVLRIIEAMTSIERPVGMAPDEALDRLAQTKGLAGNPEIIPSFFRVASAAVEYITGRPAGGSTMQ